jgi:hypothetical protein
MNCFAALAMTVGAAQERLCLPYALRQKISEYLLKRSSSISPKL